MRIKILCLIVGLLLFSLIPAQAAQRAETVVLVNSASSNYTDAQRYILPYLDHFGLPYTLLDISKTVVTSAIGDYALIVIGHRGLDPNLQYLTTTEQANISSAVRLGSGLVNFDNDLTPNGTSARYQFIQDIFGFSYRPVVNATGVQLASNAPQHYIAALHQAGDGYAIGTMTTSGITAPAGVQVLASFQSVNQPFLSVTNYSLGRAIQWASYQWMDSSLWGPIRGLDDLVWRGMVWAARKPFVMQGMPNFVTMRVDDSQGGFWWVKIANEFQLKPWLGLFYNSISSADIVDLSALVNAKSATASVHAFSNGNFFYYDHRWAADFSDSVIAANFQDATAWHTANNIPISKFLAPHYYEIGTNVFGNLQNWGIEFLGLPTVPGSLYSSSWTMLGPYRLYESPGKSDDNTRPFSYLDYLSVPGHPEFANKFFNALTEIRDDAGYEWYPDNDVAATIGKGTRQVKRALDSMTVATLFTHEYYIQSINLNNWRSILGGITGNVASYSPQYVTMDYAAQYARAKHNSKIASSIYEPTTQILTTTLSGSTDIQTQYYFFANSGTGITQTAAAVPNFSSTAQVIQNAQGGTLNSITVTPSTQTIYTGATQQYTATANYSDGTTQDITGLVTWTSSAKSVATINSSGLASGVSTGNTSITGKLNNISSSAAALTVQAPPLVITTTSLPDALLGQAYSASLSVTGGTVPYTWSVPANALPSGLTLNSSTGAISGTPTSSGTFMFTAKVTDKNSKQATAALSIVVGSQAGYSIWAATTVPDTVDHGADSSVELGVRFTSDIDGYVTSIRFYKASTNTGTHTGNLWSSAGEPLATAIFSDETASGWQQVSFASPVLITAGTVYVASYHTDVGHYSYSRSYFSTEGVDNPPLHALSDSSGSNGVYAYGSASSFPASSYQATNYWVDVVFTPMAPTASLSSISVTPAVQTIAPGATQQYTATGNYSDGTTQDITSQVTWSSSSTSVATINSAGLATAVSSGTTTIKATQGSITSSSATLTVQVTKTLNSIAVTPAAQTIAPGATQQYTATGNYSDGTTQNITSQVTWSSSSTSVATINSAGLATAVSAGTTTIKATQGSITSSSATLTVQVTKTLNSIAVTPAAQTIAPGATQQYTATGNYSDGTTQNITSQVTWSSSSTSVATINSAGLATAINAGSTEITATQGSVTSLPATLTTATGQAGYSIWTGTTVPATLDAGADSAVELGVRFISDSAGYITGIRFHKATTNTGTHRGNLWSSAGALLATAVFSGETASGWQQVSFSSPVAIIAGTVYVASYHTNVGHYSQNRNYFATAGADNSPLHALSNIAGGNGVYAYGSASSFPAGSYMATNYWVDVVFTPMAPAPSLSSITVTPATQTIATGATLQYAAMGNYSDGTTQNITSSVAWSSATTSVAAINSAGLATAVAAGSTSITAALGSVMSPFATLTVQALKTLSSITVTPATQTIATGATLQYAAMGNYSDGTTQNITSSVAWSSATTSVATINSAGLATAVGAGSTSITATLGSIISPSATLTVASQSGTSIWPNTAVPATLDAGADSSVELGVRFTSDSPGYITGIRFYKATANTGTHTGNLWSSTGTLMATAVFTGETASGWQQVYFSSPVAVTAGTVYVASYHSNVGHYSVNRNYFATAGVDNAPLHALSNNSGGNGVFRYGSTSVFPSNSYYATNYWVDVIFTAR
jgi:hypothetical protein